jgi:hypothetical protein
VTFQATGKPHSRDPNGVGGRGRYPLCWTGPVVGPATVAGPAVLDRGVGTNEGGLSLIASRGLGA